MRHSIFTDALMAVALLILAAAPVRAFAGTESYDIDGKRVEFEHDAKEHLLISRSCRSGKGKLACQARESLKRVSFKQFAASHRGGNPGAVICETQAGGEAVLARDKSGNETSFCRFKDGSLVGTGSLAWYGSLNDRGKR